MRGNTLYKYCEDVLRSPAALSLVDFEYDFLRLWFPFSIWYQPRQRDGRTERTEPGTCHGVHCQPISAALPASSQGPEQHVDC